MGLDGLGFEFEQEQEFFSSPEHSDTLRSSQPSIQ
jgi:hypothetical protein